MSRTEQEILDLTERVGVEYHAQDWGICNANADRVREFIRVYQTDPLTPAQRYAMGELVLASMNEALAESSNTAPIEEFQAFLNRDTNGLAPQLRYWSSLSDTEVFPLSEFLRAGMRGELAGMDKPIRNPIPAR